MAVSNLFSKFHWYNFNWQTANYGVSGVFVIIFWIYLARSWSPELFGQFSIIFVWMGIYALVSDLGIDYWVTRAASVNKTHAYERHLVWFKVLSAILIGASFVLIGWSLDQPVFIFSIFFIGTMILNVSNFFSCYLRGCEQLSVEAKISIFRHICFMSLASSGVFFGAQLLWVALSYLISNILSACLTGVALKCYSFKIAPKKNKLKYLLTHAAGMWITLLLVGISIKVDVLMIERLLSTEAVAVYSAASRILEGGILLATAFVLTLFPTLSKLSEQQDFTNLLNYIYKYSILLLLLSLSVAVVGYTVSGYFFPYMYGQQYFRSGELFGYMMMVFPVVCLNYFLLHALVIARRAVRVVCVLIISLSINVFLNWLLIPDFHLDGAIISYVIKEVFLLVILVLLVRTEQQ